VFLPETILVVTALASAVLGFAWRKRPEALWAVALVGTGLASFITIDMMGLGITNALHLSLWPSPIGTRGNFTLELKMNVDAFALFFQLMFLLVALPVIIASRGSIRAVAPHQGEYFALMPLAVAGMLLTPPATRLSSLFPAFGFKVAVVPFHMWAPDVYQG